ncbi:unnamed protein product [Arctogadus glacialis]
MGPSSGYGGGRGQRPWVNRLSSEQELLGGGGNDPREGLHAIALDSPRVTRPRGQSEKYRETGKKKKKRKKKKKKKKKKPRKSAEDPPCRIRISHAQIRRRLEPPPTASSALSSASAASSRPHKPQRRRSFQYMGSNF